MKTHVHSETRLRQERLKRGWLPKDVANALGITERAYRYLESGERNPSWPTACKLESLFGVPARELFEMDGRKSEGSLSCSSPKVCGKRTARRYP